MSKIFNCILKNVCSGEVKEPFKVKDVIKCLGTSKSFLWKHSENNPNGKGRPYFIRIERGVFKINPIFKFCNDNV